MGAYRFLLSSINKITYLDMGEVAIKTIKNRLFDFTNKSDKKNVTIKYNYYCNLVI